MAVTKKKKKKGKSTFDKVVAWLHLWPSIISGIVVVFVCLTGTIVVYGDEIMELSAGDARYVEIGDNHISKEDIEANLKKENQAFSLSEIVVFKDPKRSLRLRVFNPKEKLLCYVYMNPYTGEVLKVDNTIYFFFITAHLHAELLAGPIGGWIVIISTIIFFISCVTGLILWWPKKWNKTTKLASFTVKWKAKFKRLNYDLHNVFGFYSLLLCVLLSATGLIIFFTGLMNATIQATGGDIAHLDESLPKHDSTQVALDLIPLSFDVLKENPEKEAVSIWAFNLNELGAYVFTSGTAGLKSVENADITIFDKYTGDKIEVDEKLIIHEKTENNVWQLHMGQWWGQIGKFSTFLAGIVATSLPITGFLIWWGRRKKKKKK